MSSLEPVGSHELIDSRELTEISKPFAKQPAAPTPKVYLSTRAISILTLAVLLILWWAVTAGGWIEPLFLPPPADVLGKGWLLATKGYMDSTLWQHLGASLQRIGLALGAAIVTAIPAGIAIGHNRIARGIFDPLIEFYRPIPPLAYLPLIVIWFGIGEFSKVLLIYLAIFAPIAIATATGVRTVDPTKVRAAQSLGATRWQLIRHVVLPSALPDILTGIRIGLGVGWSTLVAAELIAATSGLGFMVQSAAQFLVTDVVVLGILLIAVIAFAMELGLRELQRRLVPWHGQQH
ncbi:taurine ABC transporter permease TauC [Pseudomonas syringae group sp. J254-4]|uniref:taurine ABC transporter permease TauC n=1 Tax=Pseudomonas syringae group sp. J254-4 TaxID=3079589 RepID=UPI002907073D|nr:taurine ABC transporter permease TauC [Pseudomonas syringae group sp. J254-4]MDU8457890.1 taurine ABC transporter permease TauC [Pseudomonas syringae group sp. J254-4]